MRARILDNEFKGIYTIDFIDRNWDKLINGQLVSEWQLTEILPSENLIKPIWNGTDWVEGITVEELSKLNEIRVSEYRNMIYDITSKLKYSAKSRYLDKVEENLTNQQLDDLKKTYIEKKNVAQHYLDYGSVPLLSTDMFNLIIWEEANDFSGEKLIQTINYINNTYISLLPNQIPTEGLTRIQLYCHLIIAKYIIGAYFKNIFDSYIEIFRSKMLTFLRNLDFNKLDTCKLLVENITNDTDLDGIQNIKTQFEAL